MHADPASIITADLLTDDLVDGATVREEPAAAPQLTRAELRAIACARTSVLPVPAASARATSSRIVRLVRWISARLAA